MQGFAQQKVCLTFKKPIQGTDRKKNPDEIFKKKIFSMIFS